MALNRKMIDFNKLYYEVVNWEAQSANDKLKFQ